MPHADLDLSFVPMTEAAAHEILTWRYDEPYALYNLNEEALPVLLEPRNEYFAALDAEDQLVGFCCFGEEAQVPGGDYSDKTLLDVGVGLRPDLTGRGLGFDFMTAVLRLACDDLPRRGFRVTIAAFNRRSQRMCDRLGFREAARFHRERQAHGMEFVILTRDAQPVPRSEPRSL